MSRLDQLLTFLEEDPDDPFTLFAVATEYRRRRDPNLSLQYYERLVDEHPDYVGTYYHLAALYLELGRRDDAIATYRTGIEVANRLRDTHARSELQSALMEAEDEVFE